MTRAFTLTGARVTHDAAPVAALEAANHPDPIARLHELAAREAVAEAFVLQTCNRVEEYVVTSLPADGESALADVGRDLDAAYIDHSGHEASLRHLLRVATGLESQVLGEDQILGQIRSAYLAARDAETIGPILETALLKAIHVGERARTETAINDGSVSLGSAAIQLAERERGLAGRTVLVVGAGEMAADVIGRLADADVGEVRLLNRSSEPAIELAEEAPVPVRTDGLGGLADHLREADVVITSTASSEPIISSTHADGAGRTVFVDLAQPRDVDPAVAGLDAIEVHDLDALETITATSHEERRAAASEVEAIVESEYELLIDQYKRRRADAVVRGMYRGAEDIKDRQLRTALAALDDGDGLTTDQRAIVEQLADSLVAQLLAVPTRSLREAAAEDDWETVASAIQLFDPSLLEEEPPAELLALAAAGQASADAGDG